MVEGIQKRQNAAIWFILGSNPPYSVERKFVETKWKKLGKMDVIRLKTEVYIFNFDTKEEKHKALNQSPWPFFSKMMFMKPWKPEVSGEGEFINSANLGTIPKPKVALLHNQTLSKIASYIGKPLYTSKQTTN